MGTCGFPLSQEEPRKKGLLIKTSLAALQDHLPALVEFDKWSKQRKVSQTS